MTDARLAQRVKLITVFATIFLFALICLAFYTHIKLNSLSSKNALLDTKINELSVTKASLEEGIENRSTDAYVEQQARENLGMIKSNGEVVYIFEDEEEK